MSERVRALNEAADLCEERAQDHERTSDHLSRKGQYRDAADVSSRATEARKCAHAIRDLASDSRPGDPDGSPAA